jgi:CheY-like chemotaxis protein
MAKLLVVDDRNRKIWKRLRMRLESQGHRIERVTNGSLALPKPRSQNCAASRQPKIPGSYYCVRCKWAFRVDDRSGSVTPLDSNGNPIQELEAADRLATFGVGPCPVFTRLTGNARVTQVVPPREVLRVRLTALPLDEFGRDLTATPETTCLARYGPEPKGSILQ